ncbi:MAG TPA: sensor histidine kinase [Streptosporangiaceae bacterium]
MDSQWPPAAARPPRLPRPPLTKRLRPAHWVGLDALAAGLFTLGLVVSIRHGLLASNGAPRLMSATPLPAFVLAVSMSLPVALRRRKPLIAFGLAVAAATLATILVPTVNAPYYYLPSAYLLYLVAAVSRRKVALLALLTLLALLVIEAAYDRGPGGPASYVIPPAFIVIITWTFGYTVGQRRAYAVQLREQATSSAVTEERLRIARELHDVVAHSMTVIAVQAGYGRHVIDAQPAQAREALGAIQSTSREALAEMRRMLGVLRQPELTSATAGSGAAPAADSEADRGPGQDGALADGQDRTSGQSRTDGQDRTGGLGGLRGLGSPGRPNGPGGGDRAGDRAADGGRTGRERGRSVEPRSVEPAPLMPAPGLADLDRLVTRISNTGVRVEVEMLGRHRELPPGIDLSAFRIVQEALTNVVKHAAASCCRVVISYTGDDVTVEVTDDGQGCLVPAGVREPDPAGFAEASGGHGLIGMRERVGLYGGELSAGPVPGLGFRVTARLPLGDDARLPQLPRGADAP